jgi:hypothetical protein
MSQAPPTGRENPIRTQRGQPMKRVGEKYASACCLMLGHLLETDTPTTVDAP